MDTTGAGPNPGSQSRRNPVRVCRRSPSSGWSVGSPWPEQPTMEIRSPAAAASRTLATRASVTDRLWKALGPSYTPLFRLHSAQS
jgi:hypothetical protein